ncbi:MAG TPA: DUF2298 domain-containing protein, partial [Thermomicrobiales bacterium]|nr:DUF2298 domain-containing protein [Thermomicrobiales bacterium]
MESLADIARWYLVWTIATIAFMPLVLVLFRRLTDHGAVFARALSALFLVWPAWFLSGITGGLIPFTAITLWAVIVVGGAASWYLAVRTGAVSRDAFLHLALSELGYLGVFAAYALFRGYDPTIQWQEKLSDLMLLSSVMQSETVPPHDAWLAQETINYYYVGYVPWGGIGKMTGVIPSVAYNLALASVFACTVMSTIGVAANVLGRFHSLTLARIGGALAATFLVFMATPWATFTAIDRGSAIWDGFWYDYFWDASRQLDGGKQPAITEFPSFSFQLGDLHPHLLALPFTILTLAAAWMLALLPNPDDGGTLRVQWGRIAFAGGLAGGLYAMNTWDMPAYLLICVVGLLAGTASWPGKERISAVAILIASAFIPWLPFHAHFEAPTAQSGTAFADSVGDIPLIGSILASLMSWYGDATTPWQYTGLFGYAWIVGITLIAVELVRRRSNLMDPLTNRLLIGILVATALVGLLMPIPLLILAAIPLVLILGLLLRDASISPANVALCLFAVGMALTLVTEFVYLRDVFDNRMNTVFKLYYQAWTLFAIGAGIGAIVIWEALRRINIARILLPAAAAVLVIGGVGATTVGAHQWLGWRGEAHGQGWIGMDGLFFLETDPAWAGEHPAIAWLYENSEPNDVMLS